MQRILKSKRIDLDDGSILWRNIYRIHRDQVNPYVWRGFARINRMYSPVETLAPNEQAMREAAWKTSKQAS